MAAPYRMMERARAVVISLNEQELTERFNELSEAFPDWAMSIDLKTGNAKEGKEKESRELEQRTRSAAAALLRRMTAMLEEV